MCATAPAPQAETSDTVSPAPVRAAEGNPRIFKDLGEVAEGQGFEPWVPVARHNGFRDRPDRPLRHPSAGARVGVARGGYLVARCRGCKSARA